MLQTLSELSFIPSEQADYKEYRKYFKILDICTDNSFDLNILRSSYQKLKLLFSQTPSNALYSLDSMNSYVIELDEAYKCLYQYISTKHKNLNFSIQSSNDFTTTTTNSNTDYDFPFSGKIEQNQPLRVEDDFQSNTINTIPNHNNESNISNISNVSNVSNVSSTPSYIEGASTSTHTNPSPTYNQQHISSTSAIDPNILSILENSDLRLGSTYRYIREYLQISLEDIQDKTKISTYYLNSIETNSFNNFQALIFLKGFFKAYLKYLNIPKQEECLNIYINNAKQELSRR